MGRDSKCLNHHNQRLCKKFLVWRKFVVPNLRCFVLNYVLDSFSHNFCEKFEEMKGKSFNFLNSFSSIFKTYLGYFIKILYFSVLSRNDGNCLKFQFGKNLRSFGVNFIYVKSGCVKILTFRMSDHGVN